jgi:two-component system chemotaxis response regulator CheB
MGVQGETVTRRIVVMGASSGGLDPVREILGGLPHDLRAAIFIVLHTSPTARPRLANVLARACRLPVNIAVDGDPITLGEVRVAAPDHHLLLDASSMRLDRGPVQNRSRPAIDALFRSAAISHGAATIGVVLSGSLGDGSAGLAAIKRCGGFAIVQDPNDASFPSMPLRAITADSPDAVLPVAEIAGRILDAVATPASLVAVPDDLVLEARGPSHLGTATQQNNDELGTRAALTCSDCGGPLWQMRSGPARFRCQLGHTFDATVLVDAKSEEAVRALWVAVRTLDERSRLLSDLAESNRRAGRRNAARAYAQRYDELRDAARVVEELLARHHPSAADEDA